MIIKDLSSLRRFFYRDTTPIWHVCATPYTLLGMDEWVRGFRWVNYSDCFDSLHPRILVPPQPVANTFPFDTLEAMNNHLLKLPQVRNHIRSFGPGLLTLLFFDEETESLARELDLQLIFPPADLRRRIDDKLETTRIADSAGVSSVPNVLGSVQTYDDLRSLSKHLGPDLVVQTPYGDSGETTFFISSRDDFDLVQSHIAAEREVKIMKRIRPRQAAVEGCVTSSGTVVGPLSTEIVGFGELTPYKGGWAGNEIAAGAFSDAQRKQASHQTMLIGNAIQALGYRGYFEVDWLIDQDTDTLYLGELNPRLTGLSPLTNLAAFAHADAPLFLFHLAEYRNLKLDFNLQELNQRWSDLDENDNWGQLIIKHTEQTDVVLKSAPASGVWRLNADGSASFRYPQTHRRTVDGHNEAFFLRIPEASDQITFGDDLGILVVPGRLLTENGQLTDRTQAWIRAIRAHFV
ncbi:MAG: biotin carboxylase [Acidobacteria bacterium]|nr:biotin carboxylase [Acidobacteriota bacterium]